MSRVKSTVPYVHPAVVVDVDWQHQGTITSGTPCALCSAHENREGRGGAHDADLHQVGWCSSMTDARHKVKAFILIKVDRPEQTVSSIEQTLEPLGIPMSIVDTGRRLHWSTAVVVGVPEQRLADAMLALELKGFSDVMAFHGEANTDATQRGVEQQ